MDAPEIKRSDAYDASLDTTDPEDMEKSISAKDIKSASVAPKFFNKDADVEDDEDDSLDASIPGPVSEPAVTYRLLRNNNTGKYIAMASNSKQPISIPDEYVDLAKSKGVKSAIDAMKGGSLFEDDKKITEAVKKDIENEMKKILGNK